MASLLRECCAEVPTLEVLFGRGQELQHDLKEITT